jgi:hypothetical protein
MRVRVDDKPKKGAHKIEFGRQEYLDAGLKDRILQPAVRQGNNTKIIVGIAKRAVN